MTSARLAAALWALTASLAFADVPPPDVSGCQGKSASAACTRDDGSSGTCAKDTCTRNDYSNGPPPTPVQYECLRCKTGAAADAGDTTDPPKKSGCAAAPGLALSAVGAWLLARRRR